MPSLMEKISQEVDRHRSVEEELKQELRSVLLGLPDNPDIKRLSGKCFVVSSSQMAGGRWGVESHDFKAQYRALASLLDNRTLADGVERIVDALDQASIRMKGDVSYTLHLHPDVISQVSGILGGI